MLLELYVCEAGAFALLSEFSEELTFILNHFLLKSPHRSLRDARLSRILFSIMRSFVVMLLTLTFTFTFTLFVKLCSVHGYLIIYS